MGKRLDPRLDIQLPVRIFGTDRTGATFSQKAITINISRSGAELAAVQPELAVDEILGLTYGANRVHFRVKWIGKPGTPRAGHIGLLNISPEKALWEIPLPSPSFPDAFVPVRSERRQHPRFRCQNSMEIHVHAGATFWGTLADLSLGGCYMEMPIPIEPGTKVKVGIWIGPDKVSAESEVAHKTGNVGIGLRFLQISDHDLDLIRLFLSKLSPFARKPTLSATPPATCPSRDQAKMSGAMSLTNFLQMSLGGCPISRGFLAREVGISDGRADQRSQNAWSS